LSALSNLSCTAFATAAAGSGRFFIGAVILSGTILISELLASIMVRTRNPAPVRNGAWHDDHPSSSNSVNNSGAQRKAAANTATAPMTNVPDKYDRLVESFGARTVTPTEFNNLLIEIVGLASMQFCKEKHAHGMSRAAINIQLVDYIETLERWRATTLQEFTEFAQSSSPKMLARV